MNKGKMIVLIGLPGSGKTAYAQQLMGEMSLLHGNGAVYRASWDDLRKELGHAGKFSRHREEEMKKQSVHRVEDAIKSGATNIVIDNTNLSASTRNMWHGVADRLGLEYVEYEMNTPIDECIRRDAAREGSAQVGRAVIERMALFAGKIEFPQEPYLGSPDRDIVLCDIDGTIADLTHRREKLQQDCIECEGQGGFKVGVGICAYVPCSACDARGKTKKDWYAFYQNVLEDTAIHLIINMIWAMRQRGYQILIVSGRPIRFKGLEVGKETVEWLAKHNVPYDHIFMRQGDDAREDVIVKQEILDKLPKDRIAYVFDDRDSVVAMWRRNGLTCLQVAEGAF